MTVLSQLVTLITTLNHQLTRQLHGLDAYPSFRRIRKVSNEGFLEKHTIPPSVYASQQISWARFSLIPDVSYFVLLKTSLGHGFHLLLPGPCPFYLE